MSAKWLLPALVAVCLTGCFDAGKPAAGDNSPIVVADERPKKKARTVYDRLELREMLMGKRPKEVIALIGKPDSTTDYGTSQTWVYKEIARDPITGNVEDAFVSIRGGAVESVAF